MRALECTKLLLAKGAVIEAQTKVFVRNIRTPNHSQGALTLDDRRVLGAELSYK